MKSSVTPSLENYLKAIYLLQRENRVVRVKDLAAHLSLKMASVVGGLKSLVDKGLVHHERYGYVELTQQGLLTAMEVYQRHQILLKFFRDILEVPVEVAEEDACSIEHTISEESLRRIIRLIEYFTNTPRRKRLRGLKSFVHNRQEVGTISLAVIKSGESASVQSIQGNPALKRKLLDMGMVPGTRVTVEKIAPFGSPMIVNVRGFQLTLRREELEAVMVLPL